MYLFVGQDGQSVIMTCVVAVNRCMKGYHNESTIQFVHLAVLSSEYPPEGTSYLSKSLVVSEKKNCFRCFQRTIFGYAMVLQKKNVDLLNHL
jgi:hypothetical protein